MFKLKPRPTKPERETYQCSKEVSSFSNLQKLIDFVKASECTDLSSVYIEDGDPYDDDNNYVIRFNALESEDQFVAKLAHWEKKEAAWQQWNEANKEKIAEFHRLQEEKAKNQKRIYDQKRSSAIEKQLTNLSRELKNIKKRQS